MTKSSTADASQSGFEFVASRQFTAWMAEQRVSLAFTTYQVGKVFLLGRKPDGRLEIFNRTFNRAMGLYTTPQRMYLGTLYQLWQFENVLAKGEMHNGYDLIYVPQVAYTTGDVDIHDIAEDNDEKPTFVNTLFSCIAGVSNRYSFTPYWRPPFVSRLAAEDRCHLNGLAMDNGEPAYATAVSQSDIADGWRDRRRDGGSVIDIRGNEIVIDGLSMPHSPRLYKDRLWLLDSGNGYFGYVDRDRAQFERVAFCPGYARGLAFIGDYALIGLSLPRDNKSFLGLSLDDELEKRGADPRCGLIVVDLRSGDTVHWLRIEGIIGELYDVGVLHGVTRPMAIGLKTDEIRRVLRLPPDAA